MVVEAAVAGNTLCAAGVDIGNDTTGGKIAAAGGCFTDVKAPNASAHISGVKQVDVAIVVAVNGRDVRRKAAGHIRR